MIGCKWAVWPALVVIATTASASAETVAVKASTLDQVRPALTHYDLSPSGTVSVLAQLAAFAHEHPGTKQGDEAAFLHAAVAADLLFVADFSDDAALAEGVARTFGVAKEALRGQLRVALQQYAQGMYEQPAQLALAGLDFPEHPRAAGMITAAAGQAPRLPASGLITAAAAGPAPQAPRLPASGLITAAAAGPAPQAPRLPASGLITAAAAGPAPQAPRLPASGLITAAAAGPAPQAPRLPASGLMHDTRTDAWLLSWALRPASAQPLAARLAGLGDDPCPAADSCKAPYAGLDIHSRRALALYFALSAADQRLAHAAKLGDPLAVALTEPLTPLRTALSTLNLPLLPRLAAEAAPLASLPVQDRWPQLDGVFVITSERIGYQPVPTLAVNTLQPGAALPALPAQETVATLHDLPSYVRPIDELVAFVRSMRERAPSWSPAVSVPLMVPAHVLSRVLVSLNKAGAKEPLLIGRTASGDFVSAPLHVLVDGIDPPAARSDAKLRVRLGGYTLTVNNQVTDISRVQDPTGYHFDLPRLYGLLSKSSAKHAAVSFQSDVSAVQLTLAVLGLPSTGRPIEFMVQ